MDIVKNMTDEPLLSEIEDCDELSCQIIFDEAFSQDVIVSRNSGDLSQEGMKRCDNAGVLAVCRHLWTRVTAHGRQRAAELEARGEINLMCCMKKNCWSDPSDSSSQKRCVFAQLESHFMVACKIVNTIRDTMTLFHGDISLLEFVTVTMKLAFHCRQLKYPIDFQIERMMDNSIMRDTRFAMDPNHPVGDINKLSLPCCEDNVFSLSLDLWEITKVVLRIAAENAAKADKYKILKNMCEKYIKEHGNKTTFIIMPYTHEHYVNRLK